MRSTPLPKRLSEESTIDIEPLPVDPSGKTVALPSIALASPVSTKPATSAPLSSHLPAGKISQHQSMTGCTEAR
eukprot:m.1237496 g.1237496  ORF g.1237496 m.1237496 type:complete len:74 (-) comp24669_c0_seq8:2700-2921(-)